LKSTTSAIAETSMRFLPKRSGSGKAYLPVEDDLTPSPDTEITEIAI